MFPRAGRIVPEAGREDVRERIVGEYRIVYRLQGETAILLTVFRASRLLPTLRLEDQKRGARSITKDVM